MSILLTVIYFFKYEYTVHCKKKDIIEYDGMYDVDSYLPLLYRMRYTKQTCMGFEVRKAHVITKIKKCLCLVAFDYTSLKINI